MADRWRLLRSRTTWVILDRRWNYARRLPCCPTRDGWEYPVPAHATAGDRARALRFSEGEVCWPRGGARLSHSGSWTSVQRRGALFSTAPLPPLPRPPGARTQSRSATDLWLVDWLVLC